MDPTSSSSSLAAGSYATHTNPRAIAQAKLKGHAQFVNIMLNLDRGATAQEAMRMAGITPSTSSTRPNISVVHPAPAPASPAPHSQGFEESLSSSHEPISVDLEEMRMATPEQPTSEQPAPKSLLERAKEVKLSGGPLAFDKLKNLWHTHRNVYTDIINSNQVSKAREASRELLGKIIGAPVKDRGYKTLGFLMQTAVEHQSRKMPNRQCYIDMIEALFAKAKP